MIFYETKRSTENKYFYSHETADLNFEAHAHYSFEMIWVQEGEMLCTIENAPFLLRPNDLMMILPEQIHSYETPRHSKCYLCIFSPDMVADFHETVQDKKFDSPVFRTNRIKELVTELDNSTCIFVQKALLYRLCAFPYEQSKLLPATGTNRTLAGRIVRYVENNYTKDITLKHFARESGYNYTYLSNFFHVNFRQNFSAYVNHFRLQFAVHLLENTDKNITEIASECGFSTIRNFNTAFKQYYSISPRDFRKQLTTGTQKQ